MTKPKYITPSEYAASKKPPITLQAVTKMLRNGQLPEGIKRFEKVGRFYLLYPIPHLKKSKK